MPSNASGVFTLPGSTWVETGDTVLPEQHNPPFADVEQGMTDRLMRDGRAPMTGPLAMGSNKITGVGTPTANGDAATLGWANGRFALRATTITAGTGLSGGGDLTANRTLAVLYGTTAGTAAQGNDSRIVNAVPNTRQVISGTGLSGGGNLTANRTLAVLYGTTAGTAAQGNDSRIVNAVQTSRTLTAGNGLTGGGDLTANRTVTLGTPSSITVSTGNTVSTTSHTHDLDLSGRSVVAGNGMTGGGTLSADRTIAMGTPSTLTVSTTNAVTTTSHTHNVDLSGRTITAGLGLSGGGNLGSNISVAMDITELPYLTEAPDRIVVSNTSGTDQYRCGTTTLADALPAASILAKIAGAAIGAVGTYAMLQTLPGTITWGQTRSGANLYQQGALPRAVGGGATFQDSPSGTVSGTWLACCSAPGSDRANVGIFKRIA